jgi:hypothetical protein
VAAHELEEEWGLSERNRRRGGNRNARVECVRSDRWMDVSWTAGIELYSMSHVEDVPCSDWAESGSGGDREKRSTILPPVEK